MKALYDNRVYNVVDVVLDIVLEGLDGKQFSVELSDERLIVDPTDNEVADASNLGEWYGVDDERAKQLRLMLRGEMSLEQCRFLHRSGYGGRELGKQIPG